MSAAGTGWSGECEVCMVYANSEIAAGCLGCLGRSFAVAAGRAGAADGRVEPISRHQR